MRTIVKGKNIDVPEPVRQYAERKMHRLERFLDDRTDAVVELSSEQHRTADDSQIAEITLIVDGQTLRSHAAGPTHQASLDAVIDRIERQAVDAREKPRGKVRVEEARARRIAETEPANDAIATETAPEARKGIVKTKRFAIEPMFEEDALDRMEELGHHFFIFVNAESEKVCILYKRGAGDYGLIEPMIGGAYTPGRNGHRG
ncbi:MAG TPA: ribosome-associated translation inhibitor RaiA [Candidatus Limnocylindrales bacterium]